MSQLLTLVACLALFAQTPAPLNVSTGAFDSGGPFSWRYTCYNALEPSPAVNWTNVPTGTASLALELDAPDRPAGIDVHWLLYNLSPDVTILPEGVPKTDTLAGKALQGHILDSAQISGSYLRPAWPWG